jgi:hypothetical protein
VCKAAAFSTTRRSLAEAAAMPTDTAGKLSLTFAMPYNVFVPFQAEVLLRPLSLHDNYRTSSRRRLLTM